MLSPANADLAARWSRLRGEQPDAAHPRCRHDAGRQRGRAGGAGHRHARRRRLPPTGASILSEMPSVGRVMCLTRNEHCVHERHGRFEDVQVTGPHGLVLGPDIDLRLFLGSWKHGFAVREPLKQRRAAQPAVLRRRGRGGAQDLRHRRDRPGGLRCADRASSRRSADGARGRAARSGYRRPPRLGDRRRGPAPGLARR